MSNFQRVHSWVQSIAAGAVACLPAGAMAQTSSIAPAAPVSGTAMIAFMTSAACVALLIFKRKSDLDRAAKETDLAFQVDALNAHSIVSISDENSKIVHVNDKFVVSYGYHRSELIGRDVSSLFMNEQMDQFEEIRATLASGKSWSGEVVSVRKSGALLFAQATIHPLFDKKGNHIKSVSIRTDITENKLAHVQQTMRQSLHTLKDQVYVFSADTYQFRYMNQAALKLLGWSESEYRTKSLADVSDGYDPEELAEHMRALHSGEKEKVSYELDFYDVPYEVDLQLVTPESGEKFFFAVTRDITERRNNERAKDEFVATVSHELRSPLTSIKGSMGLILSGATGDISDKSRSMLEIAYRNSDRLVLIINDILDLEKIAAGKMSFSVEKVEITRFLQDAIQANQSYADLYDVHFEEEGFEDPLHVACDPERMFQVMTNLLSNAAKFSHKGGAVTVGLRRIDDRIQIRVQDSGHGIPKEDQALIFERFTQVNRARRKVQGGTGLGLSIVQAIIARHKGDVRFESKEGEGTTFFVELPIEEQPSAANQVLQIA